MIRIDRNRKDHNGLLIRPSADWFSKAKEATELVVQSFNSDGNTDFRAQIYADKSEIRPILEKLFYGKCAYCEWEIIRSNWDVEHFRPKARVAEDPDHPGYYWLAYEWTNLYMACQYCNQTRIDKRKGKPLGKKDHFPLEKGSPRATGPGFDLALEKSLIIDPCLDNPENYITFGLDGTPVAIDNNPKGRTSIAVFHLDEDKLNRARQKIIAYYVRALKQLSRDIESSQNYPNNPRYKELVKESEKELDNMTSNEAQFAAVARAVKKNPMDYLI